MLIIHVCMVMHSNKTSSVIAKLAYSHSVMIRNSYRLRFIHCFIGAITFFNQTKVNKGMKQCCVVLVNLKLEKLMV